MNLANAEGGQAGEKGLFLFRENKSAELSRGDKSAGDHAALGGVCISSLDELLS